MLWLWRESHQNNDLLIGGKGDDKYYYRTGGGVDTIDNTGGGRDGVFFLNVTADRLSYHRKENHLVMLVDKDLKQQVQVKDHFAGDDKSISYVQPAKSASVSKAQIAQKLTDLPTNSDTAANDAPASATAAHNVNSMVNAMATFTKQMDDDKLASPQDLAPVTSLTVPT